MTVRVYINPTYTTPDQADGGIRRVVDAMVAHLPDFDVQVVSSPDAADVIANHGTLLEERPGVPMVSHNHGLYWHGYDWPTWAHHANAQVIKALTRCSAATAPSRWVAQAISRGMLIRPEVVYHGVDAEAWAPTEESLGYVLWNKARVDVVSDPRDAMQLALRLPDVPFITTFGRTDLPNVRCTGAVPYGQMRELVQRAGVYLATARETFGIGTLEALAAGVPVVGWKYGGQEEIIIEGETGILVAPGDYQALAEAVRTCLADRARYSDAARADALARWGWADKIAQYADLYRRVAAEARAPRPRVSVVITTHNLNRYLPEVIASARQADELIVVDDCGDEDARAVVPDGVTVIRPPENLGLSGARNYGAQHATGRYLLFLDADDMLAENALEQLAGALDRDAGLHIAYGALDLVNEAGQDRRRNAWPGAFDWRGQLAHINQLHYAALWRREAFVRTGGYRARDWRAEDAALWCRATSFGLRAAQVTPAATLIYRLRSGSKSHQEAQAHPDRDGDWTQGYPWRLGAATADEGRALLDRGAGPKPLLVPFGAPTAPPRVAWPVHHHQHPIVSVIIPVGPGHARYLVDALDSLTAQTLPWWEAIVVDDSGTEPDDDGVTLKLPGHPWARVVCPHNVWDPDAKGQGAGFARNVGLERARAPLVLFLDADDVLTPTALERMLRAYVASGGAYVYGDCLMARGPRLDQDLEPLPTMDYDQAVFLASGYREGQPGRHSVTALVPTEDARAVGGFDETMAGWEDWEFYLKLAAAGICGVRCPEPVLIYRLHTGQRRLTAHKQQKKLRAYLEKTYGGAMAKRCCGGRATVLEQASQALGALDGQESAAARELVSDGRVRMRYVGDKVGEHTILGRPSGLPYRVANNAFSRFFNADARDLDHLLAMRTEGDAPMFEVVR